MVAEANVVGEGTVILMGCVAFLITSLSQSTTREARYFKLQCPCADGVITTKRYRRSRRTDI
ncbi:hypothetical protein JAAARDRAFT_33031, partial [Jaapia argillacea MUCL 33604]